MWGQVQQYLWGSRWKLQWPKDIQDNEIQDVFLNVPPHFQHQNEKKQLAQPKRSFFKVILKK